MRKTKEAEDEARAVDSLKKQQLILQQKKMRIDGRNIIIVVHVNLVFAYSSDAQLDWL